MKTVYKYKLPLIFNSFSLQLPKEAKILLEGMISSVRSE